jgi:diguanylate cyclase (GGDEF)-like protein/PAS domain S-box-containing protein
MQAVITADEDAKVTSVNHMFEEMYGYNLLDVKGKKLSLLHSGIHGKDFYERLWRELIENGIFKGKIINQAKDGTHIPVWVTIKKVINQQDGSTIYIALQTDLREMESSMKKIDFLAYHDSLTGLYNRGYFENYLKHALSFARRTKTAIAVLFIDLDRFKIINDTLGHDVGDQVLLVVSKRIKDQLRESDFLGRWGGDEFVVILEGLKESRDAESVATNIIEVLQQSMDIGTYHLTTTASIGISVYPDDGSAAKTLIKHADSAMYLAKDMGKNNFRYFTQELSVETRKRLNIALNLQNAIENDEFHMAFQPQYDLQTQKIISVEALIRWENTELGIVPPEVFIPIAEESGNTVKIGYYVFEASCKALNVMKKANLGVQYIAINVSALQFNEPELIDNFLDILFKHNLRANEIEIEITERLIVQNVQNNVDILERFREHGFKISVDDFGTGYSSMSYLKELPADTIKIDKSFIDGLKKDGSDDNVIVKAIIGLAHTLQYNVVAEGIETQEQELFLLENGCDLGQGYLYSKPVKLEALLEKF